MAGSRGAAKKKAPRKPGAEGAAAKERPGADTTARPEKAEGEKRPARKPVRQPSAPAEGGGIQGRIEDFGKFLKSVRAEMKRVTWPSWAEVRAATIVVVMTLIIIAGYMGLVNWILSLIFGVRATGF